MVSPRPPTIPGPESSSVRGRGLPANWAVSLVAIAAVAALLGLLTWGLNRQKDEVGFAPVHVREVPDLSLALFDGRTIRLTSLRGRPAVINFWASWCVPCEAEAPVLEAAARTYGEQ